MGELPRTSDIIKGLYWEPLGTCFCILHSERTTNINKHLTISFFDMKDIKGNLKGDKSFNKLESKICNQILWSPKGKDLVIANVGLSNGTLEFLNLDTFSVRGRLENLKYNALAWDPSGRYLAIFTSQIDPGYSIFSINGTLLYKVQRDGLEMFKWRPRPESLLKPEHERQILKELKQFTKNYEEKDKIISENSVNVNGKKHDEFDEWLFSTLVK